MHSSSPDSMPHKRAYRSDLFSPNKLTSSELLESSLGELQSGLTKDNFEFVFQELINNESPHILLLVLSCKLTSSSYLIVYRVDTFTALGETTPLRSWMLQSFPSKPVNYDDTIHYKIISCLSTEFMPSSSYSVGDEELCARYHEVTQVTSNILKYLVSFLQAIDIGPDHRNKKGKVSQKKRKQAERAEYAAALVKKDFDVLDVDMPETSSDASTLVDNILQTQKDALEVGVTICSLCSLETKSCSVLFAGALLPSGISFSRGTCHCCPTTRGRGEVCPIICDNSSRRVNNGRVAVCISDCSTNEVVCPCILSSDHITLTLSEGIIL